MVTTTFIVIIVAFSLYCFYDQSKLQKYLFHPYSIYKFNEHYRFLSHAFIHANGMHLFLNLFCLWTFGYVIEEISYPLLICPDLASVSEEERLRAFRLAKLAYIGLFTGGIYAASITEYFRNRNNPNYSSLGASGAIEAVIFSFIIIRPFDTLSIFFIRMPAWLLGILFLAGSYYMSKRKTGDPEADRIGHEAHFWGAIFGVAYTLALKPSLLKDLFAAIF